MVEKKESGFDVREHSHNGRARDPSLHKSHLGYRDRRWSPVYRPKLRRRDLPVDLRSGVETRVETFADHSRGDYFIDAVGVFLDHARSVAWIHRILHSATVSRSNEEKVYIGRLHAGIETRRRRIRGGVLRDE